MRSKKADDWLEKLKKEAKRELSCSAHDMEHVMRVFKTSLKIAEKEKGVNPDILMASVLLHDIARVKEDNDKSGKICHARESAKMAENILRQMGFSAGEIKKVQHCIRSHRFKSGIKPKSIEAKILFDADKLDSLGAIMIMRAGAWLARNSASIFPKMELQEYVKSNLVGGRSDGRIKDNSKHSFFYELELKNKKIPSAMYTRIGKEMAKKRLEFNESFWEQLKKENEGFA